MLTYQHSEINQLISDPSSFDQILKNSFLVIFIISVFLYFKNEEKSKTQDFPEIVWQFFIISASTYVSLFITKLFAEHYPGINTKLIKDLIYHLIIAYITIFSGKAFYTCKKMILFQKTPLVEKTWTVFEYASLSLLAFNFIPFNQYPTLNYSAIVIVVLLCFSLSINMKWVAYLNFNQKLRTILLLTIILLISAAFVEFIYNESVKQEELFYDTYDHHRLFEDLGLKPFIISTFIFIVFYSFSSILVSLFNLPTSSVFEQKIGEVFSIQQLSNTIKFTNNESEIYQSLIDTSHIATFADAAWLEVIDDNNRFIDFKHIEIDKYDVFEIKTALKKEQLDLQKAPTEIKQLNKIKHYNPHKIKYQSCLIIPLTSSSQYLGAIGLLKEAKDSFQTEATDIATTLANQASTAIVNSRLLNQEIKNERYKKELKIASEVKKKLLPPINQLSEHFESFVLSESADEVGGDFYTSGKYNDDQYYFAIADISGHGTSAAFNMAQLKGAFEALVPFELSPNDLIAQLNRALSKCFETTSFVSMTIVMINTRKKTIDINRAGHCPTLFYTSQDQKIESIMGRGLGLGILRDDSFNEHIETQSRQYKTNDTILLYTDGIIESTNTKNEEFGAEQLQKSFLANANLSTSAIVSHTMQELHQFCDTESINDDVTCLAIKFN
ncbi:SpoIIE family protein phosphatase [Cyclobacteriaceae bacterium]|nr:SpoIIE family protein phosphatase [Cyclobacteriaceae bacterium]